jgi:steroid 5-alpha reductase family enzyme
MSLLSLLGLAAVLTCAALAVVWLVALRIRNASIVDIAWSLSFAPLAWIYAALGSGDRLRTGLMAAMVTVWSLRLGGHLFRRIMGHHPVEDARYKQLRRDWAPNADRRFFWFFQAQALAALLFSVPFAIVAVDPSPGLGPFEWAGAALWAIGLAGEATADRELERFKADPAARGRTCERGLWYYSRHPNYFFEWVIWCGYAVFALGSPWGWIAIACPLAMLYLLFKVTGIPATEAAALRRRGDDYRRYQSTTSAFVPWFKRDLRAPAPTDR